MNGFIDDSVCAMRFALASPIVLSSIVASAVLWIFLFAPLENPIHLSLVVYFERLGIHYTDFLLAIAVVKHLSVFG
ncbi:MAG: hypothetical protein ACRC1Z_19480 [Waterburya sp.]